MKIIIKDAVGNKREFDCSKSDKLSSLLNKFKPYANQSGKIIRSITFAYGGENYKEDDMDISLDELGVEEGHQIVASVLYNGGKYNIFL